MTLPTPDSATLSRLDALLADPRGKRVGVLGLGVAGKAMAKHLQRRGAIVVAADRAADVEVSALDAARLELRLGDVGEGTFAGVDGLVVSPGADPRQAAVRAVLARGLPVFGELELAGPLPAMVAAITGTNGKSTTTSLLGALVQATGRPTFVGGNLGDPVVAWLDRDEPTDFAVLELSSYQLEGAYRFRPRAAVILNVTPDHAERYVSIADYAAAKQRLIEHLEADDVAILNADDPRVSAMSEHTRGRVWWFSTRQARVPGDGVALRGDEIAAFGAAAPLDGLSLAHPRLMGRHNRENALAAWLALHAMGLLNDTSRPVFHRAYLEFQGLEHRLELVDEVAGVRYVNDSKATNDDAAAIAVGAMDRPVVLLAGGVDKGGGYSALLAAAAQRVKVVVAYGQARDQIAAAFAAHPGLVRCANMAEAFAAAVKAAAPGDAVLLAPACSSFDEFKNYAERGRTFKRYVAELKGRAS